MPTEPNLVPLVNRFSVVGAYQKPQGYYRSKLFIASSTTNPLVAAAGPLLSLLERLCVSPTLPPVLSLRDNIDHELSAFHSRLTSETYADELVAIAHYLLSATIDELVGKSYLRLHGVVAEFKAFTPLSPDKTGPQTGFFDILRHLQNHTTQYLDLIELAYYCLITGFEGEHHFRPDGRLQLDNLIETLFQLIQAQRVNKPHELFNVLSTAPVAESPTYRTLFMTIALTLGMTASLYAISHMILEKKAKQILASHPVLATVEPS